MYNNETELDNDVNARLGFFRDPNMTVARWNSAALESELLDEITIHRVVNKITETGTFTTGLHGQSDIVTEWDVDLELYPNDYSVNNHRRSVEQEMGFSLVFQEIQGEPDDMQFVWTVDWKVEFLASSKNRKRGPRWKRNMEQAVMNSG